MRLFGLSETEIVERIKSNNSDILIYGAGMIGTVSAPYFIESNGLVDNVRLYIDKNPKKQNETINIDGKKVPITNWNSVSFSKYHSPIIMVTNSNVKVILDFIQEQNINIDVCVLPIVFAERAKAICGVKEEMSCKSPPAIPKIIHYCWFSGRTIPKHLQKCIDSWEKYCPDYKIIRWDESNYDVNKNTYMSQSYKAGKYGFTPDIARLDILYNYGGIYLDTDVELINNIDHLLTNKAFCGVEKWGNINMGGCSGAIKGHPMIKEILDYRWNESFVDDSGELNMTTCGYYETMPFIKRGYKVDNSTQLINGMTVFSSDYFHPYDYMSGETCITDNTVSIHHFNGDWMSEEAKQQRSDTQKYYREIKKMCGNNR